MRGAIGETSFDELIQKLEELSSAAPALNQHLLRHIDSDLRLRMTEDHGPSFAEIVDEDVEKEAEEDALATAYALSLLYVDALLGTRSALGALEEQGRTLVTTKGPATSKNRKAANKIPSKEFLITFLVNATVLCGKRITTSFPLGSQSPKETSLHSPKEELSCAILCCGVLSGLGLLLTLTADRRSTSVDLGQDQASVLMKELARTPILTQPKTLLIDFTARLDKWTTQSYDAPASRRVNDDAPLIFWLLQFFNLYSDVGNLLKTLQPTDHRIKGLQLIDLERTHNTSLRARSGAAAVAEAKVSSWIVGVHAGLVQSLSHDTMCWLAIYLMNSNKMEVTRIVDHVLTAVFKDYFASGRLSVSGPLAFGTSTVGSSTETLTILLYCDLFRRVQDSRRITGAHAVAFGNLRPSVFANHFDPIIAHLRWLMGKEEQGIHGEEERTAEAAFARIVFVGCATLLCEELLNRLARSALGVQLRLSNPKGTYPPELEFVGDSVIRPIKEGGEARNNAYFSMVLYGPPGTAKTTLAKRIAYDLDWPFLEIGQRDFLREGSDRIDALADKIFRYCGYLRDVVILFDELEELILDRETLQSDKESRLLTTSMLPRIQELRDKRAVVFIFATNRVKTLDLAATRLGRFDIIKYVRLPALSSRVAVLNRAAKEVESRCPVLGQALEAFAKLPEIDKLTARMAYTDISYMLGQVTRLELAQDRVDGKSSEQQRKMVTTLVKDITAIFRRHRTSKKLARSLKECEDLCKFDRPPS